MSIRKSLVLLLCLLGFSLKADPLRVLIAGLHEVSLTKPEGAVTPLSYTGSALILLEGDTRFFRGIQIELTAPQGWLAYRGSLAVVIYGDLDKTPDPGVADLEGRQLVFEPLPNKIQSIFQIPLQRGHGLRNSPYAAVPSGIVPSSSFPLLFRLMPVIKGISEEMENMTFNLLVKPILSDEGAVKISFRYPEQLPGKAFTVLIDDQVIEKPDEERLLKEGEHDLLVLSEDYRNQSRRFMVERAKVLDLAVELQDPTPLIFFEYPEGARIFLDNTPVSNPQSFQPVEPGSHEIRFQISDYSIIRPITVQKGKTYKVALSVDVNILETN
ncbi:MAG: hypothetical protein LBQ67_01175 [Treponema sp.]|jgi:hypothetical protein|nr:hypothetical protein [Treponema sp.]